MDSIDLDARVLVAIVNRPIDLQNVREHGWYRVPLRRAPRALAVEYLAFYQTAAFGAERWAVRYLAAVHSVSVVTRGELLPAERNHPRAAERYYRFALGPILALPAPIPSRRLRRLSFISTTYGTLLRARDVTELWPRPEDLQAGGELVWGAGVNR
jgi:hypothetical protein